ncbi:NlpC/P60 family protein [Fervidibacter sacchari]|uniref:Probable endopeptidase p60 n=1 Tax=Candidatus Fervidibacter sacchari TaxID=1448929 RepID=A0ABT2EVC4_9BACT|nr:peptidoglycan endopeptidase [Candidatus Fervidibacter sacchari]MCS3920878.1 cell wall-associated NlpC family hydrolase [Candidatus Fervidibacter sacchari]WKU17794.1 NlpC/P60 family protein [Candidatus Fervidibacter sacchari]
MRRLTLFLAILASIPTIAQGQTSTTYRLYTAKAGELPEEIAKRFNVSVQDLLRANPNMVADQPLHQGEVVLVPVRESSHKVSTPSKVKPSTVRKVQASPNPETYSIARAYWVYTVQVGDTLGSIAQRFGIPVSALASANNLSVNASLVPGQVLMVPVLEQRVERKSTALAKASPQASQTQTVSLRRFPVLPAPRIFGYVGTVTAAVASIRSAPKDTAPIWSRVVRGTQVIITTERPGWYGVLMINGSTGWIRQSALKKEPRAIFWDDIMRAFGGHPGRDNSAIVAEAMKYLGVPYKYGGTSPVKGLDCSAFVQRVFAARGVRLPRTAAEQAKVGISVHPSDLRPGDRLYFAVKGNRIDHCGIYIGNGLFIHASGRHDAVVISSLYEPIYARSLVAIRR